MKGTSPALIVFGLLALFSFQVEVSTAPAGGADGGALIMPSEEEMAEALINSYLYAFVKGYDDMAKNGHKRSLEELEGLKGEFTYGLNMAKETLEHVPENKELCAKANKLIAAAQKSLKKVDEIIAQKSA